MSRILVSGLLNVETSVKVRGFPIDYYPIDYPFFGVAQGVSGVACNIAFAASTLGDEVRLLSMTGDDFAAGYINSALEKRGISREHILPVLRQTPASVVLYDDTGRRQVYCDLKDIQDTAYPFENDMLEGVDMVAACNIGFNRPLLGMAKAAGKPIAVDVHVLSDIGDEYNREFMEAADILFLSDEGVGEEYSSFIRRLTEVYAPSVIVMGRGEQGAVMAVDGNLIGMPAAKTHSVVNTVGAGDALFSAFIHYYAKGLEPVEALTRAQLFASAKIAVSGGGKGFVTEAEIEALYERFADGMKNGIQYI